MGALTVTQLAFTDANSWVILPCRETSSLAIIFRALHRSIQLTNFVHAIIPLMQSSPTTISVRRPSYRLVHPMNKNEPVAQRLANQTTTPLWSYPHYRPNSMPFCSKQGVSAGEARYPPTPIAPWTNRPTFHAEFDGSGAFRLENGYARQATIRAYNRDDEQENKRMKLETGYRSTFSLPSLPTLPLHRSLFPYSEPNRNSTKNQVHHDSSAAVVSEPSNDDSPTFTKEQPRLLATPEDTSHLTALHCFVRKQCVYIFCAESNDVDVPRNGRKKPLTLGQIGIGCLHCKDSKPKLKGSSYYPSSISVIYNATMIIQQRHFPVCPSVTKEVYTEYNKLKGLVARSASTKEYWISSANKLGMIDTKDGVFFCSTRYTNEEQSRFQFATYNSSFDGINNDARDNNQSIDSLPSLVEPSDKIFVTEYAYFVLGQMTTCTFTEADRLGKRKGHAIGFPGMACKYCYGGNGSGRFFPLTLKTFSDVSKSLHVLRNHLMKCAKAPAGLATKVSMLYEQHQNDKDSTPFGSQKMFFDHVWKRMHPELNDGLRKKTTKQSLKYDPEIYEKKGSPHSKAWKNTQESTDLQILHKNLLSTNQVSRIDTYFTASTNMPFLPPAFETTTNLPCHPEIQVLVKENKHEMYTDNVMPPLSSLPTHSNGKLASGMSKFKHRGSAKKRYLHMHNSSSSEYDTVKYSEADVSVAMILATGMGRQSSEVMRSKGPDIKND